MQCEKNGKITFPNQKGVIMFFSKWISLWSNIKYTFFLEGGGVSRVEELGIK